MVVIYTIYGQKSDCGLKPVRMKWIICDKTSVVATMWKITIHDKLSNYELGWYKKKKMTNSATSNKNHHRTCMY